MRPAVLPPGGEGTIQLQAVNLGDAPTAGAVTLSDVLPPNFSVVEEEVEPGVFRPQVSFFVPRLRGFVGDIGSAGNYAVFNLCSASASTFSCTLDQSVMELFEGALGNPGLKELAPFENLEIQVKVKAGPGAVSGGENRVSVSGGGIPDASVARPVQIGIAPPVFGVEDFSLVPEEEGGRVDAQAGSHPFQLTTTFSLNQTASPFKPPALPRNLQFKLPPGMLANVNAIPQCSDQDFSAVITPGANLCPRSSVIGVASITIDEPISLGLTTVPVPLFNLTPGPGEPARFGFEYAKAPVVLDTSVRTGSDYGVTVSVSNITELANFLSSTVTFWGVPGDPRHDEARGWGCLVRGKNNPAPLEQFDCPPSSEPNPPPFLTLPTSCALPFAASVTGSSWGTPTNPGGVELATGEHGEYSLMDEFERPLSLTGCDQLRFGPLIEVAPDVQSASTPTGLTVHVRVPQEVNENALGVASSSVKDITVALPEGVSVSPAGADGLEACSEAQVGFQREEAPGGRDLFNESRPSCPDASKIGSVEIASPLLPSTQHLRGSVYLATAAPFGETGKNPFDSLIAMYIVAEDPVSGVLVKLPGQATLDETTGRLTATFKNNPQLPFEDAELHFFGGSRAPLATPSHCGAYTTDASFGPWSGGDPVASSSTFQVTNGPGGGPCPGILPFAPSLVAGTTNINAGAFSALTTTIGREDGNQNIQTVQLHMPPGLSGILAGVPLCPEAQANAGTCGQASLIGHTVVSVGLGGEPFSVTGGEVFLTGKYGGAPFGLSIVNPAKAGPFDLGKVVVRARIEVDPHTAQLTVTTAEIPHILKGIPLQIKHVNVTIDRPGFTFNPTNCDPMVLTGTIGSVEGASAAVAVPFQVTNCATLKFAPKFQVSTSGRTSRAKGASLTARLSYPSAPQGTQANIKSVKVDLPKQLPSRLTTLQKACTNAQFEANPAGCPVASKIGTATVTTPLLPVPLTGPVIFVSHGGEAFPSLTIVLQGYGVTVDLVGATFISKQGITSTTFKTVPDVPFNTFQLTLPQGKYSALAANGNLCKSSLAMPTSFVAQNGAQIHQSTKVAVTGCTKKKHTVKRQKKTGKAPRPMKHTR
ncbi:MAG TPA: hypothetical protein VGG98_09605 [Solirubrobacteraceae bacterium]